MNVYSSFIHNNQKLETTQMSSSGQMVSQTVVPSTMDYYSITKKELIPSTCSNLDDSPELCMLSETNQS